MAPGPGSGITLCTLEVRIYDVEEISLSHRFGKVIVGSEVHAGADIRLLVFGRADKGRQRRLLQLL